MSVCVLKIGAGTKLSLLDRLLAPNSGQWGKARFGVIECTLPLIMEASNTMGEPYHLDRTEQSILRKVLRSSVKILHKA